MPAGSPAPQFRCMERACSIGTGSANVGIPPAAGIAAHKTRARDHRRRNSGVWSGLVALGREQQTPASRRQSASPRPRRTPGLSSTVLQGQVAKEDRLCLMVGYFGNLVFGSLAYGSVLGRLLAF